MFTQDTYQEDIKQFTPILSIEAKQLLTNDNLAVVYIGRETCPFCRKFAKKLSGLVPEVNTTIYYVDSNNMQDTEIDNFREQYDIITVPGFIVSKNGEVTVLCDSSMPEDEILNMVK